MGKTFAQWPSVEFPPFLDELWEDSSWRHDAAASATRPVFSNQKEEYPFLRLWTSRDDAEQREEADQSKYRLDLVRSEEEEMGECSTILYDGDSAALCASIIGENTH